MCLGQLIVPDESYQSPNKRMYISDDSLLGLRRLFLSGLGLLIFHSVAQKVCVCIYPRKQRGNPTQNISGFLFHVWAK